MPGLDSHHEAVPVAWATFLAGACIGAGVALLGAPHTGAELRTSLRSNASKTRDEVRGQRGPARPTEAAAGPDPSAR